MQVKMKHNLMLVYKLYGESRKNKKNKNLCNATTTSAVLKIPSYFTITSFFCCINISFYGCLLFI